MNAIEGLAAYIPAMRELFDTPPYIKINDDLDYQGRLHWEFVPKAESDSAPYFFNVRFYPRVKAASECFQMVDTVIDLSSDVLHSSAKEHVMQTTCSVFVALERMLALKLTLESILKNLFSMGAEAIKPCHVKELMLPITNPLRTLTAFDFDFARIKEIKLNDFLSLEDQKYVNDEVINYFCDKWMKKWHTKRVIVVNTFFSTILFQRGKPRTRVNDQLRSNTLKYAEAAKRSAGFSRFDKVFVPVHEPSGHWYSAVIDYEGKKIEIYDSWYPTYSRNFGRTVEYLGNTGLMLLLMWVAEVWSSIRGEDEPTIILKDSGWTFDPHALADFQNEDSVDCGIHVLDNLNRILRGKDLNGKNKRILPNLTLRKSIHLQRLLLAYELYDDAKCPDI
ncbi:cysteine proteinase [Gymnopus androsaceus JB14]|uniref:Cysteine proteinase n=1 Tax=Gymnopus androsaceus JB14 TaxID=1447944 RepID=A0A6A4GJB3_9AGAR|nr:cysteine proteinase [Gymnopus androsaceus JB14]